MACSSHVAWEMHSEWFELVYIVDVAVIRRLFNYTL